MWCTVENQATFLLSERSLATITQFPSKRVKFKVVLEGKGDRAGNQPRLPRSLHRSKPGRRIMEKVRSSWLYLNAFSLTARCM